MSKFVQLSPLNSKKSAKRSVKRAFSHQTTVGKLMPTLLEIDWRLFRSLASRQLLHPPGWLALWNSSWNVTILAAKILSRSHPKLGLFFSRETREGRVEFDKQRSLSQKSKFAIERSGTTAPDVKPLWLLISLVVRPTNSFSHSSHEIVESICETEKPSWLMTEW